MINIIKTNKESPQRIVKGISERLEINRLETYEPRTSIINMFTIMNTP